jgi:hypothetical protein
MFNRMTMAFWNNGALNPIVSFGIYDSEGKLIATSGPVTIKSVNFQGIIEVNASGRLRPSELYYAAMGASASQICVGAAPLPPTPGMGHVKDAVVNGQIPQSFGPDMIVDPTDSIPISITLRKVKESGAERKGTSAQAQEPPRVKFIEFKDADGNMLTTRTLRKPWIIP